MFQRLFVIKMRVISTNEEFHDSTIKINMSAMIVNTLNVMLNYEYSGLDLLT